MGHILAASAKPTALSGISGNVGSELRALWFPWVERERERLNISLLQEKGLKTPLCVWRRPSHCCYEWLS